MPRTTPHSNTPLEGLFGSWCHFTRLSCQRAEYKVPTKSPRAVAASGHSAPCSTQLQKQQKPAWHRLPLLSLGPPRQTQRNIHLLTKNPLDLWSVCPSLFAKSFLPNASEYLRGRDKLKETGKGGGRKGEMEGGRKGGREQNRRRKKERKTKALTSSLLVSHTYWFLKVQLVIENWDRSDNFHGRHIRIWWCKWSVQTGHGPAGIRNSKSTSLLRRQT